MKKTFIIIMVVITAVIISACGAPANNLEELPQAQLRTETKQSSGPNASSPNKTGSGQTINAASGELSDQEAAGLLFMREEEKLAYDLYLAFQDLWGIPVFGNIAASEQTHMDSILMLLDKYGLPDPAANAVTGKFNDAELQALYDELFSQGQTSLEEALRAAAAVEEVDILDLQESMRLTDKADIIQVYENLLAGSHNHLRAFVALLETRSGQVYQPLYLSAADYQVIYQSDDSSGQGQPGGYGPGGKNNNN